MVIFTFWIFNSDVIYTSAPFLFETYLQFPVCVCTCLGVLVQYLQKSKHSSRSIIVRICFIPLGRLRSPLSCHLHIHLRGDSNTILVPLLGLKACGAGKMKKQYKFQLNDTRWSISQFKQVVQKHNGADSSFSRLLLLNSQ